MKKILFLVFLLASVTSFAQFPNYTNINGRYKWIAGKFDSTFTIPSGTTPSLRVGGGTGPGALFYSTTDSTVYQYTGTRWTRLRGTDTAHVVSAYVRNTTASPMTAGQVVYINGSTGTTPTIALAVNTADSTSAMTFGFVRGTIAANGFGWITSFGPLEGVNTNAYDEGEVIYLDSIPGQFTHDKPQAPYHMVTLGYIVKKSGGNGTIFAKIQNGYELDELHNVKITSPVRNNAILAYDSVASLWKDTTLSSIGGVTGTGTTNYVPKFTSSSAIGNSQIFDNGTNVGIGTTSPQNKFVVSNAGADGFEITPFSFMGNGSSIYSFNRNTSVYGSLAIGASQVAYIRQGGFETMRLTSAGNVGIGTGGPDSMLTVTQGSYFQRGVRMSGLPSGIGTKELRIDANGVLYANDTLTNDISGSGTTNYIPKFTSSSAIGNSIAYIQGNEFVIHGTTNGALNIRSTSGNSNYLFFTETGVADRYLIGSPAGSGDLVFRSNSYDFTNGSERMRLDASGRLGINTSSPAYRLDVNGSGRINGTLFLPTSAEIVIGTAWNTGTLNFLNGGTTYLTFDVPNSRIDNRLTKYYVGGAKGFFGTYDNYGVGFVTNNTEKMTLDASGNLGLGVTPSAWSLAGLFALQIQSGGFYGYSVNEVGVTSNAYFNSGWKYINNSFATQYSTFNGVHRWYTAPSGTAGNAISFTQAMTLDASGRLGIGTTSPTQKLDVSGGDIILSSNATYIRSKDASGNTPRMFGINSSNDTYIGPIDTYVGGAVIYGISANVSSQTFYTGASARLHITSGGNVGIGTTSPSELLQVGGSSGGVATPTAIRMDDTFRAGTDAFDKLKIYLFKSSTQTYGFGLGQNADLQYWAGPTSDGLHRFFTSQTERLRITGSGEVLINTTTDAGDFKLQVSGNAYVSGSVGIGTSPSYKLDVAGTFRTQDNTYLVETGTGSVGINTNSVNASAILEIKSTAKGFLPPRMTNAQMVAIATPAAGLVVYDTTNNKLNVYDGTNWVTLH